MKEHKKRYLQSIKMILGIIVFMPGIMQNTHAAEWSGYVAAQVRSFTHTPIDPQQEDNNSALSTQPEFYHKYNGGHNSFTFVPFFRVDEHDSKRTHADIRELTWVKAADNWELHIGIRKIFWGVTESQHLVDIINQTDLVESPDGEEKLGQPMIDLVMIRDWGTVNVMILPGFRERTFPGIEGRFRSQPRVDTDQVMYESSSREQHTDSAIRWSHFIGDWDFGLSHFYGTSRDPVFIPGTDSDGNAVLIPYYKIINQTGLDIQATKGNWLWKLEMIHRSDNTTAYTAMTGGLEYTFYGLSDSDIDLGIVAEYLFDDRDKLAPTPFQDDFMLGMRFNFNDSQSTEALIGAIIDLDNHAQIISIEASRRFGNQWKINLEARRYGSIPSTDPLFVFHKDGYAEIELAYYF